MDERKKIAIIKIPEGIDGLDIQTNGVSILDIINALNILSKHFAKELVEEGKRHVGNDPVALEKWLNLQYQKPKDN